MIIKKVSRSLKEWPKIKHIMRTYFPLEEQTSMNFLMYKCRRDNIDFYAYYDRDEFIGITYTITYKQTTFLLYLAIVEGHQSKGYGSSILRNLRQLYSGNRILLNIELLDKAADNYEQRVRRKNFYLNNGFISSGLIDHEKNVVYENLTTESGVTERDYRDIFKFYKGRLIAALRKKSIIEFINQGE